MNDKRITHIIKCLLIIFFVIEMLLLLTGIYSRIVWDDTIMDAYGEIPTIYTFLQKTIHPVLNGSLYLVRGGLVVIAYYMLLRYKNDFHVFEYFIKINIGIILIKLYSLYYIIGQILEHPYTVYDLCIYNMSTILQMSVYWSIFYVIKRIMFRNQEKEKNNLK